jgi:hypothetical protein
MKKFILFSLYYIIILLLLGLYLVILGLALTFILNLFGVPQTKYNNLKQIILLVVAALLAKFILFPAIKFVASKIKKTL